MKCYIDGFVLSVPKKNIAACRRIAQKASRIWRQHGHWVAEAKQNDSLSTNEIYG